MSIGSFMSGAIGQGQAGVDNSEQAANAQLGQMQQSSALQIKMQMAMAQIQMTTKFNEALAKMLKAIGDAVKGLAG
jgi:hypothetical protein